MRIIDNLDEMTETARGWLASGTVGFVPIGGELHDGHRALIQFARQASEILVVGLLDYSQIFLTSSRLPRDLFAEARALGNSAISPIDIIFVPRREDLFPPTFTTYVSPGGPLVTHMQRGNDPGYVRILATTLVKLFQLARPDLAFFGQKDALQVALVRQLVRDLNIDVRLRVSATVRANDGVPLSARNQNFTSQEREAARLLYQALLRAKARVGRGEFKASVIANVIEDEIAVSSVGLEQIMICHPETFVPVSMIVPQTLLMVEARIGHLYLSDNIVWMSNGQWRL
jgi:pantoate--beta-alanine ligase